MSANTAKEEVEKALAEVGMTEFHAAFKAAILAPAKMQTLRREDDFQLNLTTTSKAFRESLHDLKRWLAAVKAWKVQKDKTKKPRTE